MSDADKSKEYSNGEVTVVWKPDVSINSANFVRGLPKVFIPKDKPWIHVNQATTAELKAQVDKCPSGALSYYMNADEPDGKPEIEAERIVEVTPNGPLMVYGNLKVKHSDGTETDKHRVTAFCRCGASQNKPYCDGTHRKVDFKG